MKFTTYDGTTVNVKFEGMAIVFTDSQRQDSAQLLHLEHGRTSLDVLVVTREQGDETVQFVYAEDFSEGPRPPWAILHDNTRWVPYLMVDPRGAWTPSGGEFVELNAWEQALQRLYT